MSFARIACSLAVGALLACRAKPASIASEGVASVAASSTSPIAAPSPSASHRAWPPRAPADFRVTYIHRIPADFAKKIPEFRHAFMLVPEGATCGDFAGECKHLSSTELDRLYHALAAEDFDALEHAELTGLIDWRGDVQIRVLVDGTESVAADGYLFKDPRLAESFDRVERAVKALAPL